MHDAAMLGQSLKENSSPCKLRAFQKTILECLAFQRFGLAGGSFTILKGCGYLRNHAEPQEGTLDNQNGLNGAGEHNMP